MLAITFSAYLFILHVSHASSLSIHPRWPPGTCARPRSQELSLTNDSPRACHRRPWASPRARRLRPGLPREPPSSTACLVNASSPSSDLPCQCATTVPVCSCSAPLPLISLHASGPGSTLGTLAMEETKVQGAYFSLTLPPPICSRECLFRR